MTKDKFAQFFWDTVYNGSQGVCGGRGRVNISDAQPSWETDARRELLGSIAVSLLVKTNLNCASDCSYCDLLLIGLRSEI